MVRKALETETEWRQFVAAMVQPLIKECHALYLDTANPIHALSAYRTARAAKIDIPVWILDLFDQWAEVLCVQRPKSAKAIADALGLGTKAGASVTKQAETQARNLLIVQRVYELRHGVGPYGSEHSLEVAFSKAAEEFDLSFESVRDIWYRLTRSVVS